MDTSSLTSQTRTIIFMDEDLYRAAVNGKIETFSDYKGRLDCLRTPRKNTLLHIYLENKRIKLGMVWQTGSDKFVKYVLDKCPSLLFEANAKGEIPLHIDAKLGHLPIIQLLISRANEADQERDLENGMEPGKQMVRTTDNEENMALHTAARYGHVEIAQRLIEEDPDFEYPPNKTGETPLFIAARRGYHGLVSEILNNFKSVAHGGPNGTNALHAAVMARSERTIKVILEKKKHLTKGVDENERTPLHYAAHLGCRSIVKLLLESDKSAAYVMDKEKMTPLVMAARQGYPEMMKDIIKHCPDCCELVDRRGWNFVHFAVVSLPYTSLREFLEAQESRNFIDDKDIHGNTPLHVLANSRFDLRYIAERYKHDKVTLGDMDLHWSASGLVTSKKQEEIFEVLEDIGHGEVGGAPVRPLRKYKRDLSRIDRARENNLVVAALIATITFTAVFQVPGGYNSEKGGDQPQGSAILSRDPAFVAFIMTDAIALISSLLALAYYFASSRANNVKRFHSYILANNLIRISLPALVVAFVTGTYSVLQPSLPLAIVICIIGSSFFPCYMWLRSFIESGKLYVGANNLIGFGR